MTVHTHRFSVGKITCIVISDGIQDLDGDTIQEYFPDVPAEQLVPAHEATYAEGDAALKGSLNILVILTGDKTILVDAGFGPESKPNTGHLIDGLAAEGITPEAVDTIIITHAHGDHIVGLSDSEGTLLYPNANYVMWRGEWEHWMTPENQATMDENRVKYLNAKLKPLEDKLTLIDSTAEIAPGVTPLLTPGHTPGHLSLEISSNGHKFVHVVDAFHMQFQLPQPGWSPKFDWNPEMGAATRRALMAGLVYQKNLALLYHFPFPGLGYVEQSGEAFTWKAKT